MPALTKRVNSFKLSMKALSAAKNQRMFSSKECFNHSPLCSFPTPRSYEQEEAIDRELCNKIRLAMEFSSFLQPKNHESEKHRIPSTKDKAN